MVNENCGKQDYVKPEMVVIAIEQEDIITSSCTTFCEDCMSDGDFCYTYDPDIY